MARDVQTIKPGDVGTLEEVLGDSLTASPENVKPVEEVKHTVIMLDDGNFVYPAKDSE